MSLYGIFPVAEGLFSILDILEIVYHEHAAEGYFERTFSPVRQVVDALLRLKWGGYRMTGNGIAWSGPSTQRHKEILMSTTGLDLCPICALNYKRRNDFFGAMARNHPLWATLGHIPANDFQTGVYRQVVAQLLLAVVCHDRMSPILDTNANNHWMGKTFEVVLDLANDPEGSDLFYLPEEILPPDAYFNYLCRMADAFPIRELALYMASAPGLLSMREPAQ